MRCSRHTARVQAYSQAQGLEETEHEIAVVVQRLIRADFSGVLFTADPLTGDLMHMTGNFVPGLGEKLVSGQANAQTFTLARPKGTYSGPAELKRLARALYRNACRLEKELGGPQDIEWAIADGRLYILQSRPITTLNGYKAETAEWNDSLRATFSGPAPTWRENAPHVLTPFSCSLRKGLVYEGVDLCDGSSMGVDGYPHGGHHRRSRVYQSERPGFRHAAHSSAAIPARRSTGHRLVGRYSRRCGDSAHPDFTLDLVVQSAPEPDPARDADGGVSARRSPPSSQQNPHWCAEMLPAHPADSRTRPNWLP